MFTRYAFDIIPLIEYNKVSFGEGGRMRMKYLSTFEAAEKWGISHRRVNVLCNEGRITGAQRAGKPLDYPGGCRKACRCQNPKRKIYQKSRQRKGGT